MVIRIIIIAFSFIIPFSESKSQYAGRYMKRSSDYMYKLILNQDSTFEYTKVFFETKAMCKGKWVVASKDTIVLSCSEGTLAEKLQRGYIEPEPIKVEVLRNGRLRIGKVELLKF